MLLKQEGAPMWSVDLSTRECGGHVVVTLRGELDIADAVSVAQIQVGPMREQDSRCTACSGSSSASVKKPSTRSSAIR